MGRRGGGVNAIRKARENSLRGTREAALEAKGRRENKAGTGKGKGGASTD